MRNLNRLTNAANNIQSREDYKRLLSLAQQAGRGELIPLVPDDARWPAIDIAAADGAENLLRVRPDLRAVVARIYPEFAEEALCQ